jgi:hypothetical protein
VLQLDEDDAPDWSYWRLVPTVTLLEAVSLSLNIDPRKLVPHPAGGRFAGIAITRIAPPELYHRLDLAMRCVGETLPAAKSRYGKEHVRLYSFTAWATGLEWDLPSELEALARELERRHERTSEKLYNIARKDDQLGTFKKAAFLKAYQAVYMTEPHHPPASGWPLQAAYQKRRNEHDVTRESLCSLGTRKS